MKYLGLVLIFISILLGFLLVFKPLAFEPCDAHEKMEALWAKDVRSLESSGKLPSFWFKIKDVDIIFGDEDSKNIFKSVETPLVLDPQGDKKLEVIVDRWSDANEKGVIVQYHLIDLKSKNTIWELGRTFNLTCD